MPPSDALRASARFYKAHGLGNDYLVMEPGDAWAVTPDAVAAVCHRLRGAGSDGIILVSPDAEPRLRGFNPDGTEFERSGNGLRIVASWLHREGRVGPEPFHVRFGGSRIGMEVHGRRGGRYDVSVAMGTAQVGPAAVALDTGALDAEGRLGGPDGEPLAFVPVSVGNPHLVVWGERLERARLDKVGPWLTAHPALEAGANVQLAESVEPGRVRCLVWERGAGHTTASGTSACAVAVSAVHRGDQEPGPVEVVMEGGSLHVVVDADLGVTLRGPVEEVMEGALTPGFVAALGSGASGTAGA